MNYQKMTILVVGGAGYIGSHMVKMLCQHGHDVVVYDNLTTGHADAVVGGELVCGSLGDREQLARLFSGRKFDAVMHFASSIQVGESITNPGKYYVNNVSNTINLLDAMTVANVDKIIFSSTAAIFGEPQYTPIDEAHPVLPINPYGSSKAMVEQILRDYDRAHGLKSICLRYFNAAGADPEGLLGERHDPETHLIPLILQVAGGDREQITVFGRDYDTPDGTCIRDYIHVWDLCKAHMLALDFLSSGGESDAFNLGNGSGFSVQEVIDRVEAVTQKKVKIAYGERRAGDPARLVADARKAEKILGWKAALSDLDQIISDAWRWELSKLQRSQ